jgi:zinc transport system substrate-binding protein
MARLAALATGVVLLTTTVGCNDDTDNTSARLRVAVAFFPLAELARNVAGEALGTSVDVVSVVPDGEQAHDFEPTPQQIDDLGDADLVVYLGNGFQAGIEKAIESLPTSVTRLDLLQSVDLIDVGTEIGADDHAGEGGEAHAEEGSSDPHVWLSPRRMATMADAVATAIATALDGAGDDVGAAQVRAGATAYTASLAVLDTEFAEGLRTCEQTTLVTGHHAFGYLAADYGLTQVSISGISPSEEPSAETLEEIADFATANGISTIFFEENLPADLSRTVADEIGATTERLDPIEAPSTDQLAAGATYVSLMGGNLDALRTGLGCW